MTESQTVGVPIRATVGDWFSTVRACGELELAADNVVLDASQTTRIDPLPAAMLAATAADRRAQGRETRWAMPVDDVAARFVGEIQMDRLVEGKATDAHRTLEMRQLTALDPSYTAAVGDLLQSGGLGMDEAAAYPVQLCLNELLQNVFEWSGSRMGCVVLTRWYHRTRNIRVVVVDRGVGIPARLRSLQIAGLQKARDAGVIIAAVTSPRLTSRVGRAGGLGLKTIHETVTQRGGTLTVISLGAKVAWAGGKRTSSPVARIFHGTAIDIDFRPDAPVANPDDYVPVF